MLKVTVLLLVLGTLCQNADAACSFPADLVGSWVSSTIGTLTFTTSQVTILSVYTYGNLTFDCDTLDGTQHMLRSTTTVTILNNQLDVITCFNDITSITSGVTYKFQLATTKLTDANNWRIKVIPTGTTLTASSLCDEPTPYAMGTQEMIVKSDSVSSAYIQCPDVLLGTFSYTYDSGSGNVCTSGSYLDVCTSLTTMAFDLLTCSQMVAFSSSGVVRCVHSQTDNATSTTYVNVYNADGSTDESTTYRYACLAVTSSGGVVYVSESAQICQSNQTSTYVATGATLQLTANLPVDSTTGATTTTITTTTTPTPTAAPQIASASGAGIAIGISFALLVIILLVGLCLFLFCGRDRLKFYKKHCGGSCYVCCSKTQSCMSTSRLHCCSCLSVTKRMLLRFYDCCCPECSQGKVEPSVYDHESTVVVTISPPSDEEKEKKGDNFVPLPPSVEEVDKVDSKGNPRRLPPIASPRAQTIVEEEPEDVPQSPTRLPPIVTSPSIEGEESQRVESPVYQQITETDPHVPATTEPKDSTDSVPADVKMEPEGNVSEIQMEQDPVLSSPPPATPVPPEQSQGDENITETQVEVTPTAQEPVNQDTPTVQDTQERQETVVPTEAEEPTQIQVQEPTGQNEPASAGYTEGSAEQTTLQMDPLPAQPTQQTTAVREHDPAPIQHSTPREADGTDTRE